MSRSNSLGGPMFSPMTSPSPTPNMPGQQATSGIAPPPPPGGLFQPYHNPAVVQPSPSYQPLRVTRRCAAPAPVPMGVPIRPRRSVVLSPPPNFRTSLSGPLQAPHASHQQRHVSTRQSLPMVPGGFAQQAPPPHMRPISKQMSTGQMVVSPRFVPVPYTRDPLASTHSSLSLKSEPAPIPDRRRFVRAMPALSISREELPPKAPFPTVSETSSRGLHSSDGSSGGDRTSSSLATTQLSAGSAPGRVNHIAASNAKSSDSFGLRGNNLGLSSSFGFDLRENDSDVSISKLDLVKAISDSNERYADIVGTWCATMKGDLPSAAQASLFTLHSTLTTSASSAKKLVTALQKALIGAETAAGNSQGSLSYTPKSVKKKIAEEVGAALAAERTKHEEERKVLEIQMRSDQKLIAELQGKCADVSSHSNAGTASTPARLEELNSTPAKSSPTKSVQGDGIGEDDVAQSNQKQEFRLTGGSNSVELCSSKDSGSPGGRSMEWYDKPPSHDKNFEYKSQTSSPTMPEILEIVASPVRTEVVGDVPASEGSEVEH